MFRVPHWGPFIIGWELFDLIRNIYRIPERVAAAYLMIVPKMPGGSAESKIL